MCVHLSQHSSDLVVLDAQLLHPLLVVCACLVRDGHVLELSFLGEVDVVHGAAYAGRQCANRSCPISIRYYVFPSEIEDRLILTHTDQLARRLSVAASRPRVQSSR